MPPGSRRPARPSIRNRWRRRPTSTTWSTRRPPRSRPRSTTSPPRSRGRRCSATTPDSYTRPMADGPDLGALLQQAQQMQQQLLAAQAQAADEVHEGTAGGGAVKIEVTGGMEFRSVTIRPDAVDPDDVEM